MTKEESDFHVPESRIDRIKYSVTNLWDQFGHVDSVQLGIVINVGMALLGVLVFFLAEGIVAAAGVVWAVLNIYPVLQWVFGL